MDMTLDNLSAEELRAILKVREQRIKELEDKKAGIRNFELSINTENGRVILRNLIPNKKGAPFQMYAEELKCLLEHSKDIESFLAANADQLGHKVEDASIGV